MSVETSTEPVLLLKTKSSPVDAYEELLSKPHHGRRFDPSFVPVLQHKFEDDGIKYVRSLLEEKQISDAPDAAYGGMIFTSQRAVEALAKLVEDGKGESSSLTAMWVRLGVIALPKCSSVDLTLS
jgi:uroporphyrinogen-III synthase